MLALLVLGAIALYATRSYGLTAIVPKSCGNIEQVIGVIMVPITPVGLEHGAHGVIGGGR